MQWLGSRTTSHGGGGGTARENAYVWRHPQPPAGLMSPTMGLYGRLGEVRGCHFCRDQTRIVVDHTESLSAYN